MHCTARSLSGSCCIKHAACMEEAPAARLHCLCGIVGHSIPKLMQGAGASRYPAPVCLARLATSPAIVLTTKYGWSANMERIMKAQALSDGSQQNHMRGMKSLEVNPHHPLIQQLKAQARPRRQPLTCLMLTAPHLPMPRHCLATLCTPQAFATKHQYLQAAPHMMRNCMLLWGEGTGSAPTCAPWQNARPLPCCWQYP